jgi:hypothetical protein
MVVSGQDQIRAACLQDDIDFGGPLEGLRFGVALGEPDLDGSLEIGDALEHTAAD